MRRLTKLQSVLFVLGGLFMVVGVGAFVMLWHQRVACWVFLAGAVLFSVIQSMQVYEGSNRNVRRLKRMMNLADLFFILAGILMVDTAYNFLLPLFRHAGSAGYYQYIDYVYNKWVILLLIAALLEAYTTHRIGAELRSEK